MKQVKLIVAFVTGLFAFTSVQAGELSVSGSMQATYQSEQTTTTGNPLGINTDITLSGSTDTDFGTVTMSLATDGTFLSDSGADHKYSLATGLKGFDVPSFHSKPDVIAAKSIIFTSLANSPFRSGI